MIKYGRNFDVVILIGVTMIVRLMLSVVMLCGQGELLASGVRVLIRNVPVERLVQKFTLNNFPAQTLKREGELVPRAAAFVDKLLQLSCQSCFDKIFDGKNFEQYYLITDQTEADLLMGLSPAERNYVRAYAGKLWSKYDYGLSVDVPYEVTVSFTDEATLAASLLDKFAELDEFYQAIHAARQQLAADMPVDGVRREAFIAQQEQYAELYRHTRAEVDAALADLRGLLDEHGREYPHDILASVDSLEAHLRSLIEARDTWLHDIKAAVKSDVTPHMRRLQEKGEELFSERKVEAEKKRLEQEELDRRQEERDRRMASSIGNFNNSYTHDLFQSKREPVVDHYNSYVEQQKQHQDTMNAVVAIDPLDIF